MTRGERAVQLLHPSLRHRARDVSCGNSMACGELDKVTLAALIQETNGEVSKARKAAIARWLREIA